MSFEAISDMPILLNDSKKLKLEFYQEMCNLCFNTSFYIKIKTLIQLNKVCTVKAFLGHNNLSLNAEF